MITLPCRADQIVGVLDLCADALLGVRLSLARHRHVPVGEHEGRERDDVEDEAAHRVAPNREERGVGEPPTSAALHDVVGLPALKAHGLHASHIAQRLQEVWARAAHQARGKPIVLASHLPRQSLVQVDHPLAHERQVPRGLIPDECPMK
eukprot:2851118-Pyramimonas_sp.AAC.1